MILVECGEGWTTFDNSCYKLEASPQMKVTAYDGRGYCTSTYGADLMVPNSKDEAVFIGTYISSFQVIKYSFTQIKILK